MTALPRLSKADTIVLLEPSGAGAAALATDVGQERTNLTNATTYVHESPSARAALTYPREISVVVDLNRNDIAVLVEHGNGTGSYTYRMTVTEGAVVCAENGVSRVTGSLTVDGVVRRYMLHWSTRPEGTSVRHELLLVNMATNTVVFSTALAAAPTTNAAWNLYVNGDGAGGGSALPVTRYRTVRIGRRHHSTTEAWEDYISQTAPPSLTALQRTPLLTFPSSELPIAESGAFAGPAYLWAGAACRQADRRLVTALVNLQPRFPYVEANNYAPTRYFRDAYDDDAYHLSVRYLWGAWTHPKTNKVRARVFARVHENDGLPTTAPVYLRLYSIEGHPNAPAKYYYTTSAVISAANGTLGAWVELGELPLARDAEGFTYLALAFSIGLDAGVPGEGSTRLTVRAVQIEPIYVESEGMGLDVELGG